MYGTATATGHAVTGQTLSDHWTGDMFHCLLHTYTVDVQYT
jgi:hypothetical protein